MSRANDNLVKLIENDDFSISRDGSVRFFSRAKSQEIKPKLNKSNGYMIIQYNRSVILLHRAIYFCVNGLDGVYSNYQVDHIDRDKLNNLSANLRLVSPISNSINRDICEKDGYIAGVTKRKNGNFRATIKMFGVNVVLCEHTNSVEIATKCRELALSRREMIRREVFDEMWSSKSGRVDVINFLSGRSRSKPWSDIKGVYYSVRDKRWWSSTMNGSWNSEQEVLEAINEKGC